jgi:hypothetical protein
MEEREVELVQDDDKEEQVVKPPKMARRSSGSRVSFENSKD